jgi:hypothetical protein
VEHIISQILLVSLTSWNYLIPHLDDENISIFITKTHQLFCFYLKKTLNLICFYFENPLTSNFYSFLLWNSWTFSYLLSTVIFVCNHTVALVHFFKPEFVLKCFFKPSTRVCSQMFWRFSDVFIRVHLRYANLFDKNKNCSFGKRTSELRKEECFRRFRWLRNLWEILRSY